ncbi:MAG: AAA family ATPase [Sphingorhabdus sp.]
MRGVTPSRDNGAEVFTIPTAQSALDLISPNQWEGKPAPNRVWLLDNWIPVMRATLLTGEGGSGKSLLAQQLATCVAMGIPFMGIPVRQQASLYITCEDDPSELHRRQEAINRALGISMADLRDRMHLVSRVGDLDNAMLDFDYGESVGPSAFYRQVESAAIRTGSFFLVLDNIAHLFSGNENIRLHVATFCNAMEKLARDIGGTVLFLGHPSKAGAQFSGSTAWENQVRSRLYLGRPDDDDGQANTNLRTLSRSKSNYAAVGEKIEMQWHDWAFLDPKDDRCQHFEDLAQVQRATAENDRFMDCLDETNRQQRPVSASQHAQNFAPKAFARMTIGKGIPLESFARAMERLFHLDMIEEADLFKGPDRKFKRGLRRTESMREGCGKVPDESPETRSNPCGKVPNDHLREGCGTVQSEPPETRDNPCGKVAGRLFETIPQGGAVRSPLPIGREGDRTTPPPPAPLHDDDDDPFD